MVIIQDKNQRVFLDIEFTKIHLHTNNIFRIVGRYTRLPGLWWLHLSVLYRHLCCRRNPLWVCVFLLHYRSGGLHLPLLGRHPLPDQSRHGVLGVLQRDSFLFISQSQISVNKVMETSENKAGYSLIWGK